MQAVQFIDIIFLAMVAGFIILRLRSTLGRRSGHEQKPEPKRKSDNVVNLVVDGDVQSDPKDSVESNTDLGMSKLLAIDPGFAIGEFLSGAEKAFELIVSAFSDHDKDVLRPLLSEQVYQNFASVIDERIADNYFIKTELIKIAPPTTEKISVDGLTASISVIFESEQINTKVNVGSQIAEEMSSDQIDTDTVIDLWTFKHDFGKTDPNWTLIATRTLDE